MSFSDSPNRSHIVEHTSVGHPRPLIWGGADSPTSDDGFITSDFRDSFNPSTNKRMANAPFSPTTINNATAAGLQLNQNHNPNAPSSRDATTKTSNVRERVHSGPTNPHHSDSSNSSPFFLSPAMKNEENFMNYSCSNFTKTADMIKLAAMMTGIETFDTPAGGRYNLPSDESQQPVPQCQPKTTGLRGVQGLVGGFKSVPSKSSLKAQVDSGSTSKRSSFRSDLGLSSIASCLMADIKGISSQFSKPSSLKSQLGSSKRSSFKSDVKLAGSSKRSSITSGRLMNEKGEFFMSTNELRARLKTVQAKCDDRARELLVPRLLLSSSF